MEKTKSAEPVKPTTPSGGPLPSLPAADMAAAAVCTRGLDFLVEGTLGVRPA